MAKYTENVILAIGFYFLIQCITIYQLNETLSEIHDHSASELGQQSAEKWQQFTSKEVATKTATNKTAPISAAVNVTNMLVSEPRKPSLQESHPQPLYYAPARLSCKAFLGPDDDVAQEMVYWRDIPSDSLFVSPFYNENEERYLTFELDMGGFNNVRLAMEVAVVLAVVMGRTLVLPPLQALDHLLQDNLQISNDVSLADFFDFDSIQKEFETVGGKFNVISFEEFLQREAMTGHLRDSESGNVTFPPENRTNWNGMLRNKESIAFGAGKVLWSWMRRATTPLHLDGTTSLLVFPAQANDPSSVERMQGYLQQVLQQDLDRLPNATDDTSRWMARFHYFVRNPTTVNASTLDRLANLLADRRKLFLYSQDLQEAKCIHLNGEGTSGDRMLFPFYSLIFFEDWRHDLWIKRFVRDHFRYKDELQCAAARIVAAVRRDARQANGGDPSGGFDSLHIRRGDFIVLYKMMDLSKEAIYFNNTRRMLRDGRTVFVATDESNSTYFEVLRSHYNLRFLSDYKHLLEDLDPKYYGMIDQLVASRGDTFVGTYFSTFSSYINRLRGYAAQRARSARYELGVIDSYYAAPDSHAYTREIMRFFYGVRQPFWMQEFADCWRNIDFNIELDPQH